MTKKEVKLGLCGAGRWGKQFLGTIRQLPQIKLVALSSRNPQSRDLVSPHCEIFDDWRKMLDHASLDCLIVATPPSTHFEIGKEALFKKLPCLMEKPLTLNFEEAQALHRLWLETRSLFVVDHVLLFHPDYLSLKERLKGKKILSLESEGSNWGPFRDYSSLWDYGAHDMAFCIDLLGDDVLSVGTKLCRREETAEGSGESYETNIEWSNGARAKILSSNIEKKKTRILKVKTEDSTFVFDDMSPESKAKRPLEKVLTAFADSILAHRHEDSSDLSFSLKVTKILDRAQSSLKTREAD